MKQNMSWQMSYLNCHRQQKAHIFAFVDQTRLITPPKLYPNSGQQDEYVYGYSSLFFAG